MSATDEAISTQDLIARRSPAAGTGVPAVLRASRCSSCAAKASGSTTPTARVSRRLQQRASVGHCHPRVVEAIARRPRCSTRIRAICTTRRSSSPRTARDPAAAARPRHVHLHRQRGQRSRVAHRRSFHRRPGSSCTAFAYHGITERARGCRRRGSTLPAGVTSSRGAARRVPRLQIDADAFAGASSGWPMRGTAPAARDPRHALFQRRHGRTGRFLAPRGAARAAGGAVHRRRGAGRLRPLR